MKCPVCNDVRMREIEKNGVLIDVCPDCKGVWLDRGELDKLMSEVREVRQEYNEWYHERKPQQQPQPQTQHQYQQPPYHEKGSYDSKHGSHYYKHKKKKSVLDVFGDLFD